MSEFYDEMAEMASELLDENELGQAQISLRRITKSTPENKWEAPIDDPDDYPLKAVAKRVNRRYENGIEVIETADIVTFAPLEIEPEISDFIVIDGVQAAIVSLKRIPSAGTVVAWQAVRRV